MRQPLISLGGLDHDIHYCIEFVLQVLLYLQYIKTYFLFLNKKKIIKKDKKKLFYRGQFFNWARSDGNVWATVAGSLYFGMED